jgi:hypothetical protein
MGVVAGRLGRERSGARVLPDEVIALAGNDGGKFDATTPC